MFKYYFFVGTMSFKSRLRWIVTLANPTQEGKLEVI